MLNEVVGRYHKWIFMEILVGKSISNVKSYTDARARNLENENNFLFAHFLHT